MPTIQWVSIENRKLPLFPKLSSIQTKKKSPSKHTITPCQRDGKLSPTFLIIIYLIAQINH